MTLQRASFYLSRWRGAGDGKSGQESLGGRVSRLTGGAPSAGGGPHESLKSQATTVRELVRTSLPIAGSRGDPTQCVGDPVHRGVQMTPAQLVNLEPERVKSERHFRDLRSQRQDTNMIGWLQCATARTQCLLNICFATWLVADIQSRFLLPTCIRSPSHPPTHPVSKMTLGST